jgi:DNA-binding GntR family transcriptional regulator
MAGDAAERREVVSALDVAQWLRDCIRAGRVAPGQRLIEADLTRDTGASRSRVREALQRLEAEGLVVIEEFRGASVRAISADEIRQIYRARMALEGLAAHDFAAADDAERKDALARLQDELNACEESGDYRRFVGLNDAWHRLIMDGAGNSYVVTFVERLRLPLYQLLFSTFYAANRIDDANAGHRQITAAILAGDAEGAERLMRAHIGQALGAVADFERERTG